ncbi:hypothetical protein BD311DRAFT_675938, partial [Dichomitus squalens]
WRDAEQSDETVLDEDAWRAEPTSTSVWRHRKVPRKETNKSRRRFRRRRVGTQGEEEQRATTGDQLQPKTSRSQDGHRATSCEDASWAPASHEPADHLPHIRQLSPDLYYHLGSHTRS